jgi:4-hydroxy-4-methyl-2-oxoglutarate aldolase
LNDRSPCTASSASTAAGSPARVADEVAVHARAILLADVRARRKHYDALGIKPDTSVDHEAVEEYYASV